MFRHLHGCILALLSLGICAGFQATAQDVARPNLSVEDFARDPSVSPPQVSPDGAHLAWIEDNQLVIYDTHSEAQKVLAGGDNHFGQVHWVNNDYIVVYMKNTEVEQGRYLRTLAYSPIVVNKDAKYLRQLFEHDGIKLSATDLRPILRYVDGPAPYALTYDDEYLNQIDVATGKRTVGARLMRGQVHFFDHLGREHVGVAIDDHKATYGITSLVFYYKAAVDASGQTLILSLLKKDNIYYTDYRYSEYDNAIYWTEFNAENGQTSIYKYDMTTAEKRLYKTGPNRSMGIAFDNYGRIVGLTTLTDKIRTEWTDPYYLKIIGAVEKIFPQASVDIVDMTKDGKRIVLWVSAPEAPDSYYVYSADSKELVQVGTSYPELDGAPLAEMRYVTYKARDGLEIPAYITKRKDTPSGAPLIVLPHGGPAARDVYGFDYEAQFFASKGYVVLQPQYRGSAGFSDAFERAGNKHLDQMVTDLEDGVRFLQGQGMIDPAKVCVVGWSWGGYLAQAGLAFTPDTYACGISGDGVSDLFASLNDDNDAFWGGYSIEYWHSVIGDEGRDAAQIRATSPIEHVSAIKAPLLLIHGEHDEIVSVHQSERMNAAMKKAGKTVTYMPVKYMLHGPDDARERISVLKAMDEFITAAFAKTPTK